MQEIILNEAEIDGEGTSTSSNDATYATTSVNASVTDTATRPSHKCIYGVGTVAVLAIGLAIFFAYTVKSQYLQL